MKRRVSEKASTPAPKKAKTQAGTKKDKKKTASHAELLLQHMNVACTGAREGEILLGIRNTTQDAVMKGTSCCCYAYLAVSGAVIPPRSKELDSLRAFPEIWERFLEKLGSIDFFSTMTTDERKEWLAEHETSKDMDIAEVDDCFVRTLLFRI
jgi:hypothetical protein